MTSSTRCLRLPQQRSIRKSAPEQYARMQEIYAEEAPLLFMYETPFAVAVSAKVDGYIQTPLGNNVFDEVSISR